ncbi:stage III sporulation protein AB [Mobilitalea sibirica]|uniref:Stage III sporulation protein AB n=1 Tax=Mobilitalea sibirica TaxID=1462919 RepID=A0A8J7KWB1_9FIRM|nr:stage III sporulation protein AB [Mobilitalea sibirica]MBH1940197.1 stage III sporulation protein AB [Mobilitalea sibirica]
MLITKIIGCLLVIISTTGMGMFFSNELRCRIEDLKELKKLILLLRGDIRYANTPLPEAISGIARRHNGGYETFLSKVSSKLNELSGITFSQIWKEAVEQELTKTSLTKKDKLHLVQFGESLGYLDKDMQMNTLDLYINQLEDETLELSKTVKEKAYLLNSLGIMAGIFISIIML